MTVSPNYQTIKYTGNGLATNFSWSYASLRDKTGRSNIVVEVDGELKVQDVDYTVTDNVVKFFVAPAFNAKIVLSRNTTISQEINFVEGEDFPAEDYENSLDKLTQIMQEKTLAIETETKERIASDNAIIDSLNEEIDRAEAKESALDAKVAEEINRATSKENILQGEIQANTHAVEEERARAIAKESELQSNINAVSQSIPTKTSDLINDSLQDKLIAGENITIIDNVISSQGGSGGGEERITLATTWQEVTDLYLAGKSMVLDDESGHLFRLTGVTKNDNRYNFLFQTLAEENATTWTIYTNGYWEEHIRYLASRDLVNTKQDIIPDLATIRSNAQAVTTKQDIIPDIDSIRSQVAVNTQRIEDMIVNEFPNAIPVGFPTIQDSFVSGFSAEDYMQFPFTDISRGLPFDIYFSFTTDEDVTTQQNILDSHFGIALAILNGKGVMALSSNGTSWDIGTSTGTNTLLPNTTYYAKFSWDGTAYTTALSLNDTTYVSDMQLASNLSPYKTTIYIGGSPNIFGAGSSHPFKGIINFMGARVYLPTAQQNVWVGMSDIGLASRANVSLSNLDAMGIKVINDLIDTRIEAKAYDGSVE